MSDTYFNPETPENLRQAIERARNAGNRVRLFLGDTKTGKAWMDTYGVTGRIGRSMGPRKVPILLAHSRSIGGEAILDHCILKMQDTATGRVLYQHPLFHLPIIQVIGEAIFADYSLYARCRTEKSASRLAAFLRGECFAI